MARREKEVSKKEGEDEKEGKEEQKKARRRTLQKRDGKSRKIRIGARQGIKIQGYLRNKVMIKNNC